MTSDTRPSTPRERARAELIQEIKRAARARLAEHGAAALSMRTIAHDVGLVSASALYRYFPSRDALLTALITDAYTALGEAAEAADARVRRHDVSRRWTTVCRAVRDWAVANPHEWALIYGSPVPGYAAPPDTVAPATRVPLLLGSLLTDLAAADPDAAAECPPLPRRVRKALSPVLSTVSPGVPDDLVLRWLIAWTYLFGAVSMELFGHRHNVIDGYAVIFDHEIARLGTLLGLTSPRKSGVA
jgi:AcrR family transcriptional regulator